MTLYFSFVRRLLLEENTGLGLNMSLLGSWDIYPNHKKLGWLNKRMIKLSFCQIEETTLFLYALNGGGILMLTELNSFHFLNLERLIE